MGPAWLWPVPSPREVPHSLSVAVLVPPSWLPLPGAGVGPTAAVRVCKALCQPGVLIGKNCPASWASCLGKCQSQGQSYFSLLVYWTAKTFCEMCRTTTVTQYSETWEKCRTVKGTTVQWTCTVVPLFYKCWRLWNLRSCSLEWSVSGCQSREAGLCLWTDDTNRKPAMLSSLLTSQWEPVLPLNHSSEEMWWLTKGFPYLVC